MSMTEGRFPFVTVAHFSVYNFLTSNPASLDNTLPLYHIYPLHDAHLTIALTFAKYHSLNGSPRRLDNLLHKVIQSWSRVDIVDKIPLLLSAIFDAPIMSRQPDGYSLVFPNATHINALNCTFFISQYAYNFFGELNGLSSQVDSLSFRETFPQMASVEFNNCVFHDGTGFTSTIHFSEFPVEDSQISFTNPDDTRLRATEVTVKGCYFIFSERASWNIYPGHGIIQNDKACGHSDGIGVDYTISIYNCYVNISHRHSNFIIIKNDVHASIPG
jgi:hypothetical protein